MAFRRSDEGITTDPSDNLSNGDVHLGRLHRIAIGQPRGAATTYGYVQLRSSTSSSLERTTTDQPALAIHARRKHRKNSKIRESMRDRREYETRWDIIDAEEQFANETNSVTVTGDEWWLKFHGQADELPWSQEEVDAEIREHTMVESECLHHW